MLHAILFFSLINELILGNTEPLNVSGGRNRLTNTRMRSDHEFLKHLQNILGPAGEASEDVTKHKIVDSTETMKIIVKEGLDFLQDREEFWTNVK